MMHWSTQPNHSSVMDPPKLSLSLTQSRKGPKIAEEGARLVARLKSTTKEQVRQEASSQCHA